MEPTNGKLGVLRELSGPNSGTVYELKDVCVLGRALDCQVHIRDLTVSRRHARITRVAGRYLIEDLGSGNGTYVNDVAVKSYSLKDHDLIRISSARFVFEETAPRSTSSSDSEPHIVTRVDARKPFYEDPAKLNLQTTAHDVLKMASRLKTLYAVSEVISSILDIDELLKEILSRLFDIFPRAERAFIMLFDEKQNNELLPRAVKRRNQGDEAQLSVSKTILHEVLTRRQAVLSHDAMEDTRFKDGHSVANFGIRAMVASPLICRGEVLGIVYLDSRSLATFSEQDLELLSGIAGQSAAALGNARMHEELLKRQRLEQDLRLAERIQQSFLPKTVPLVAKYTFFAQYDPAYEVGGDFYDFIPLPDDRLAIVVADVSGKGVSAALYMARLTRDLRSFALANSNPAQVLKAMNRTVLEGSTDDLFVTVLYVVLDPRARHLAVANAGHMPVMIRKQQEDSVITIDAAAGLPLGILADAEYGTDEYQIAPGDSVVLFTDGLVEAMSPAKEMYGMKRLRQVLGRGSSHPESVLRRLRADSKQHGAGAAQFDDTTILCFGLDAEA